MIFKDLRLVDGQLVLSIDLSNLKYYEDAIVESISLDTAYTFNEDFGGAYVYEVPSDKQAETLSIILSPANFGRDEDATQRLTNFGDIVYVKVNFSGTEKANAPCGIKSEVFGIALNWRRIYNQGMVYIKDIERNCADKSSFIDFSLRLKALELAIKFGDCTFANSLYKHFFGSSKSYSGCNCGK